MASSVSSLSYLDPAAYQTVTAPSAVPGVPTRSDVSATAELRAIQKQGDLQSLFNDSLAAALLQPATGIDTGTAMSTLVNNMLKQVLGAYQAQSPATGNTG
ncbi:MAG TPA: hypothetical protein VMI94_06680 [Bryobacteraceae bacterium]|nr:hypothetical protein [Bryobacteraceae bacterium]